MKKQTFNLRWGGTHTKKKAYWYKIPYARDPKPATNPFCPICKCGVDGASHILAGCQDAHMKGFYINRHNRAVCIIQKAVSKAAHGNNYMVMDAGKQDELPDTVHNQRLPDSLRPPDQITAAEWKKLRPMRPQHME